MLETRDFIQQQLYFSINKTQVKFYCVCLGENALEGFKRKLLKGELGVYCSITI